MYFKKTKFVSLHYLLSNKILNGFIAAKIIIQHQFWTSMYLPHIGSQTLEIKFHYFNTNNI